GIAAVPWPLPPAPGPRLGGLAVDLAGLLLPAVHRGGRLAVGDLGWRRQALVVIHERFFLQLTDVRIVVSGAAHFARRQGAVHAQRRGLGDVAAGGERLPQLGQAEAEHGPGRHAPPVPAVLREELL